MNQEMQNVASAIMYTAMMHDKKQEEIEAKAKKYDKLKEAIGKIKEEIKKQIERDHAFAKHEDTFIQVHNGTANGLEVALDIIDKHTEGLI